MGSRKLIRIGIIGGGPKGLYTYLRIAHLAKKNPSVSVRVTIFEPQNKIGCGIAYNTKQPTFLLMNYCNFHINFNDFLIEVGLSSLKSFKDFIQSKYNYSVPEFSRAFSPRSYVGEYLNYLFEEGMRLSSENIQTDIVKEVANEIKTSETGYAISTVSKKIINVDKICLTTGHGSSINQPALIYPISKILTTDLTGKIVRCKGIGLTFIDFVIASTEGKGGIYDLKNDSYISSGKEPKMIVPYSRTNLPMMPRLSTILPHDYQPWKIGNAINYILTEIDPDSQVSFSDEILPLIQDEMRFHYYRALLKDYDKVIPYSISEDHLESEIINFHKEHDVTAFSFYDLLFPHLTDNKKFIVEEYLEELFSHASMGFSSHFVSAISVIRYIGPMINELLLTSSMDQKSIDEFDRVWKSAFQRIAYGPPLINFKKLLIATRAGLVSWKSDLENYDVSFDCRITTTACKNDMPYESLILQKMAISSGTNIDASRVNYLEIDNKGHIRNDNLSINDDILTYGIPAGAKTYNNDTLSPSYNNFTSNWLKKIFK